MQKQLTYLTVLIFRRITHIYRKWAGCTKTDRDRMTIRPGIKCRMWSRSVPPEAGRISLRSVQADPGQRVVTGTSQAINYVHKRIRFQSHNVNPGHFPCSKKQQRPIQIRIGCGKSDPANWNLPDSGYSLAVMAQRGRTRNGPGMFTASISRYSPSRL